jgi:hypothetical protein
MNPESLIPQQKEGTARDTRHAARAATEAEAASLFERAKARLLNPATWASVADGPSASFLLYDKQGKMLHRSARQGDYVRVDLPGPGRSSGSGYDWVVLDLIKEGSEEDGPWVIVNTRPAADPTVPEDDTAHFFSENSTGTFLVRQKGTEVVAEHFNRNIQPNTSEGNILDKARALIVGAGAAAGLSDAQWSNLIKGLIELE